MYAKVENGVVVSVGALPVNYQNVSSFNALDDESLKAYGFYPLEINQPEFNDLTEKYFDPGYVIEANKVSLTYTVVALSSEELAAIETNKWKAIRRDRNSLLSATDWSQLPDAALAEGKVAEYVAYRTALRSLPQTYSLSKDVVWPTKVA